MNTDGHGYCKMKNPPSPIFSKRRRTKGFKSVFIPVNSWLTLNVIDEFGGIYGKTL